MSFCDLETGGATPFAQRERITVWHNQRAPLVCAPSNGAIPAYVNEAVTCPPGTTPPGEGDFSGPVHGQVALRTRCLPTGQIPTVSPVSRIDMARSTCTITVMRDLTDPDLLLLMRLYLQKEDSFVVRRCVQRFAAGEMTALEAVARNRNWVLVFRLSLVPTCSYTLRVPE